MEQSKYGLILFIFLAMPPVAHILESVMALHMHMQMPMLVIAGLLMARFFQIRFPQFFEKWNQNGIPGILLFIIIILFWMMPRTMDEALTELGVEIFKFISLPFLAGVPLRDSWTKLSEKMKNGVIILFTVLFLLMGWLYIYSPVQLCNNYLQIEQITLGWAFITTSIGLVVYLIYITVVDRTKYEIENNE